MIRPFLAALALGAAAAGQDATITSAANDTIVLPGKAIVRGTSSAAAGSVIHLLVGGKLYMPTVQAGGTWEQTDVDVPAAAEEWSAAVGVAGVPHKVLVTPGPDLPCCGRPVQEVCLVWEAGADAELLKIATGTLNAPLRPSTPAEEAAFVLGIQTQAETAFTRFYAGIGVRVVAAPGPGVHVIRFTPTGAFGLLGDSPVDFGNANPAEETWVFIGSLAGAMVHEFRHPLRGWEPMQLTDPLAVRITDVGEALGRTAAHELGHSLGLVVEASSGPGAWMRGADGSHNYDGLIIDLPRSDRFKDGWYLMDPGPKTKTYTRIAEPSLAGRGLTRVAAGFNVFNRSYLGHVQP
jgi:hypothetical protein